MNTDSFDQIFKTLTVSVVVLSFYALGIERFNSASRINKPYSSVPSHVIGRLLVIWLSSILLATPDLLLSRVRNGTIYLNHKICKTAKANFDPSKARLENPVSSLCRQAVCESRAEHIAPVAV